MKANEVEAILVLAGIEFTKIVEIDNRYYPETPSYRTARAASPWWKVFTQHGQLVIGRRKRVYAIDWEYTNKRGLVTEDDVTKHNTMVHAWTLLKAVEYMTAWKSLKTVPDSEMFIEYHYISGKEDVVNALSLLVLPGTSPAQICHELQAVLSMVKDLPSDSRISLTCEQAVEQRTYRLKFGKITIVIQP
jgi:hypothetical protein